ncbi:MAG: type II toxin-antitoxin system RelE/ParE family toxin [Deltaproteobacteria bacterium]|nr:type II toxin-antitoxin system RelE/ParE family toxin [Deltaproteobacteria bacterium]
MSWPRLHPEAAAELQASIEWTQERSPAAAKLLFIELDATLTRIATAPCQFPVWQSDPTIRRAVLTQHPYIVYSLGDAPGETVVLAVAHTRREPGYWRSRSI